ncbi:unnamed protein product [Pieris macdunnoughi]|uniref:Uncharacterized protein n=1 Tax=Pieris macdunnoughi TaxID=345717 RepID=A0A821SFL6_9NEOP|nr:unnamed protein product [Pieris macdunnoughi]
MSGRPRTTSFAEGSKSVRKTFENQPPKPPLGGVKISTLETMSDGKIESQYFALSMVSIAKAYWICQECV